MTRTRTVSWSDVGRVDYATDVLMGDGTMVRVTNDQLAIWKVEPNAVFLGTFVQNVSGDGPQLILLGSRQR